MQSYSTKQRKLLLSYLAAHADEELAADVISRDLSHEGVSVSAVYRNLAALEADGKIQKVTKSGTRRAFYRFSDAAECRCFLRFYTRNLSVSSSSSASTMARKFSGAGRRPWIEWASEPR